jgi:hypothetical protein
MYMTTNVLGLQIRIVNSWKAKFVKPVSEKLSTIYPAFLAEKP